MQKVQDTGQKQLPAAAIDQLEVIDKPSAAATVALLKQRIADRMLSVQTPAQLPRLRRQVVERQPSVQPQVNLTQILTTGMCVAGGLVGVQMIIGSLPSSVNNAQLQATTEALKTVAIAASENKTNFSCSGFMTDCGRAAREFQQASQPSTEPMAVIPAATTQIMNVPPSVQTTEFWQWRSYWSAHPVEAASKYQSGMTRNPSFCNRDANSMGICNSLIDYANTNKLKGG